MKKHVFGKKLKRDTNERKALFKNLLTSLVLNEKVKTTEAKAKAIRAAADKLITKAKKGGRDAYRALEAEVHHEAVVKLIDDLAIRFTSRNGGYTRIVKTGRRVADNAPMAIMEWVEKAKLKEQNEKSPVSQRGEQSKIKKEAVKKVKKETKQSNKEAKKPEKKETKKRKK